MNQELREKMLDSIRHGSFAFCALDIHADSNFKNYKLSEIEEVLEGDTENFRPFPYSLIRDVVSGHRGIQYSRIGSVKWIDISKYACEKCHKIGVKLWRQPYGMEKICQSCLTKDKPLERYKDCLGGYIPAVPYLNTDALWGFTSVPADCCDWWESLPDNK